MSFHFIHYEDTSFAHRNKINTKWPKSESHLMKAITTGDLILIQEYLKQRDINWFLRTGWTLLLYASLYAQSGIIKYLLTHGADPNKHKDGFTPLMALCNSTNGTAEEVLECLTLLIEAKADTNFMNMQRQTALMYACEMQVVEIVAELIKHVSDINVRDSDGRTALSYAVAANKPEIVKILLDYNAETALIDKYNLTPKDIANAKEFTEISVLLNGDEEEINESICEISQPTDWKDLFSNLYPRKKDILDYDISVILHGMNLEKYGFLFEGMDLKTFLQLTENDLCNLGLDISVHREQFLENLEKFHSIKWQAKSIANINKYRPYTIYDGIISLGNVKKHVGVIASSFQYIKCNLIKAAMENIYLTPVQKIAYKNKVKETRQTLKILKREIIRVKEIAEKIDEEYNIDLPATYVSPKKDQFHWAITFGITHILIAGLFFWKTT